MSIRYRHGLIAGFFGGWAFGTLTTGYLTIMSILLAILAALLFFDYWRGIASWSEPTEYEP
jgi:hypothetical protein